jgi:PKHD-type hydroxylase
MTGTFIPYLRLSNYYWYFKSAIPTRICDEIIKTGLKQQEQRALTGGFQGKENLSEKEIEQLHKKRKSNVSWLNHRWIYNEIQPYIHIANRNANWNFDWDWTESCQFTKYKLNQFYDWHCDCNDHPYDMPNEPSKHGKIRKLSVTVSLVDSSEYEGGEFEFDFRNKEDSFNNIHICNEIKTKGSIVVFPSFIWHRVKPVTSGIRYSLVAWNIGRPFR